MTSIDDHKTISVNLNDSSEATRAVSNRYLILIFSVFLSTGVCVSVMKKLQRFLRFLRRRLRRTYSYNVSRDSRPPDPYADGIRSDASKRNRDL